MFDGFESKRSREQNHHEDIVIQLEEKVNPRCLRFDFTYFRHNSPQSLQVDYRSTADGQWNTLIPQTNVKAFAANIKEFTIKEDHWVYQLKITVYPDGGINRIVLLSK